MCVSGSSANLPAAASAAPRAASRAAPRAAPRDAAGPRARSTTQCRYFSTKRGCRDAACRFAHERIGSAATGAAALCDAIVKLVRARGGTIRGSALFGIGGVKKPLWFPGGLNYFTGREPYASQFVVTEKDSYGQRTIRLCATPSAGASAAAASASSPGGTIAEARATLLCNAIVRLLRAHGGTLRGSLLFGGQGIKKPLWFPSKGGLSYFIRRQPYATNFTISKMDEYGQSTIQLCAGPSAGVASGVASSAPPASGSASSVQAAKVTKEQLFISAVTSSLASLGGSATMGELFARGPHCTIGHTGTVELPAWVMNLPSGNRNGGLKKQCLTHPQFRRAFTVTTINKVTKIVLNRSYRLGVGAAAPSDDMADFRRNVIAYLTKYGPSKVDLLLACGPSKTRLGLGVKMPQCVLQVRSKKEYCSTTKIVEKPGVPRGTLTTVILCRANPQLTF